MPWQADGTYLPTVGTYTGVNSFQRLEDDGADVEAAPFTAFLTDLKTVIETTVRRDGGNSPSNNLPMNGKKHTNVADASADSEYAAWGQVKPGLQPTITEFTATGNVTLTHRYRILTVDASSAAVTLNLPDLDAGAAGYYVTVTKSDNSSNAVTLDAHGTDTIKGAGTLVMSDQFDFALLMWNGTDEWLVLAQSAEAPDPVDISGKQDALGTDITAWDVLTQAQYDALTTKHATTLYVIVG